MPESMSVPWAWVIPVYFPWNLCLCCLLKCNFRIRTSDLGRALVRLRQQPPLLSWFQSCHPTNGNKAKGGCFFKVTPLKLVFRSTANEVVCSHYTRVQHTAVFSSLLEVLLGNMTIWIMKGYHCFEWQLAMTSPRLIPVSEPVGANWGDCAF